MRLIWTVLEKASFYGGLSGALIKATETMEILLS
jgi:hypothetical protein